MPQLDPNQPLEKPIWHSSNSKDKSSLEATFISPLYDGLETNIPHNLMRFSDKPFPGASQLFPKFGTVLHYLEEYSTDVRHLIRFQTQVVDVKLDDPIAKSWSVTSKQLDTGIIETKIYDAVVAASGHYTVPSVPSIKGISSWNKAYPGIIRHSKLYNSPEGYQGEKVVIVGNSASGIDIGTQIGKVCGELICSSRSPSYFVFTTADNRKELPEIVEFLDPSQYNRAIRFENGDVEENIDAIIFCTGYLYSFPFLSELDPPVIKDGSRTLHAYKHFFNIQHPTLVFPVLNHKVIPFPFAENQSAVFARVWSGRLSLPSKEEMYEWETSTVSELGDGKQFHAMPFPMDADYLNELYDWAASADPKPGLDNDGRGKEGIRWGEEERWLRERFPQIKIAFANLGDERHSCQSLQEIGFDFEAWKIQQQEEQEQT